MEYVGIVEREKKYFCVSFPQAPGCATFGESHAEMVAMAQEALEGWLESWLVTGDVPPEPKPMQIRKNQHAIIVRVPAKLATAIAIRRARDIAGITQADLAKRLKTTQPRIAKLESGGANPSVETLADVLGAMGNVFELSVKKQSAQPGMGNRKAVAAGIKKRMKS